MIEGVSVVPLQRHIDERGYLYEVIHASDEFLPKFGQTYVVASPARGTIRGFHRHDLLWDYFCVVRGTAKIIVAHHCDDEVKAASERGCWMKSDELDSFVSATVSPAC